MDSICLVINALDFQLRWLLSLNWVQHCARSNSIVSLACRGAGKPLKFAINCAIGTDPVLKCAALQQAGRLSVQVFLIESPLSRHKLINFGLICVLLAAILALGIVIVCKGASNICAEFNNNGCAAIRAVKRSFLFAHSKVPCRVGKAL